MAKSGSRFAVTVAIGLMLAFGVGVGVKANSDDCGGFFCGYGDCWIQFFWCQGSSCTYTNLGGGECEITMQNPPGGCQIDMACDGGAFGWTAIDPYHWRVDLLISD